MALQKCPRCELNYILDGGKLCTVCQEEVRGTRAMEEPVTLCSACGEASALPGEDMCKHCMAELRSMEALSMDAQEPVTDASGLQTEPVSGLREMERLEADEEDEEEKEPLSRVRGA